MICYGFRVTYGCLLFVFYAHGLMETCNNERCFCLTEELAVLLDVRICLINSGVYLMDSDDNGHVQF